MNWRAFNCAFTFIPLTCRFVLVLVGFIVVSLRVLDLSCALLVCNLSMFLQMTTERPPLLLRLVHVFARLGFLHALASFRHLRVVPAFACACAFCFLVRWLSVSSRSLESRVFA